MLVLAYRKYNICGIFRISKAQRDSEMQPCHDFIDLSFLI